MKELKLSNEHIQYILNVLSQSPLRYVDTAPIISSILEQTKKEEK